MSVADSNYQVPDRLRDDLAFLLRVAAERVGSVVDEELAPLQTQSRPALILQLVEQSELNQKTLAEKTKTHPNAITTLLNSLESHQLIRREQNSSNRREYLIKLTASGKKLLSKVEEAVKAGQKRSVEKLTLTEQQQLNRLLLKLIEAWS